MRSETVIRHGAEDFAGMHQAGRLAAEVLDMITPHVIAGANIEHAGCVTIPAIENDGDVDVQNITITKRFWSGDSVTNNMIERNAGRFWKAFIVQRCGGGTMRQNIVIA